MQTTTDQRERTKAMIDDPMRWPMLVLPLKNPERRQPGGWPLLGSLRTGMSWQDSTRVVYIGTMYEPGSETETYETTDALLDAGWIVD